MVLEIPKILIVIQHEPADKVDGKMTVGEVVGVSSNVPSRYLDIVVCEGEVTLRDKEGCACGWRFDTSHPRGEVPFQIEIEPPSCSESVEDPEQHDERGEEWNVFFWQDDKSKSALVLKASDVVSAAQRVQQEFPHCRITHIEQADLGEHPMTYLDEEDVILPVGGPRVQTGSDKEQ
jgi:hypothetical protein